MNDRIANAFRAPAALTDDDLAEMVALWAKEAKAVHTRRKRLQNAGGANAVVNARRNEQARQRRLGLAAE
ncbi:hypothetical protein [Pseudooceanicola nitratireducens]|uniref:hypothetical protein n=1 Tax=Pseudooceanicola nitratireducens TaxID=517719 RepID=UPI0023F1769A|nr:hypothetical protein [Pseudooceanicola nitratireducens]